MEQPELVMKFLTILGAPLNGAGWHFSRLLSGLFSGTPAMAGPYPWHGWDFPEEIPEDPGNALRGFPGIPLESIAWTYNSRHLKPPVSAESISRILSPQYSWGRLLFQRWFRRGPLRAGHGIPSSTEGLSEWQKNGTSKKAHYQQFNYGVVREGVIAESFPQISAKFPQLSAE